MITLYQFSPHFGLPNASPFCLKLETYLRMAKIPFQIRTVNNPAKSPKGKLPFIKDHDKVLGDTHLIILHLKQQYGAYLDQNLTPVQQAQTLAITHMVEEHLYWIGMYARWIDPVGWPSTRDAFFEPLPSYLKLFLPKILRKRMAKTLYAQGIGRHSAVEIYQLGIEDINAIATLLGTQSYFWGDSPTSIDATLFAFLANIIWVPQENILKKHILNLPSIPAYCERIKKNFYPEWV